MTALIFAALAGAYASRKIHIDFHSDVAIGTVEWAEIWEDLISLLTLIGTIYGFAIAAGKGTRNYTDEVLLPWLTREFGFKLDLPRLPAMPQAPQTFISAKLNETI